MLLTANTAASADMQEENRHSSAICAAVITFSAIVADSAVEMNTGAAFEKNNGYIAAQSAAESSAWISFAAKYPTGRRFTTPQV